MLTDALLSHCFYCFSTGGWVYWIRDWECFSIHPHNCVCVQPWPSKIFISLTFYVNNWKLVNNINLLKIMKTFLNHSPYCSLYKYLILYFREVNLFSYNKQCYFGQECFMVFIIFYHFVYFHMHTAVIYERIMLFLRLNNILYPKQQFKNKSFDYTINRFIE